MKPTSAGLLMYRIRGGELHALLAHPGGPFWEKKDAGAWTIPKGKANPGEELLQTALREFQEETGLTPHGPYFPLQPIRQKSGKIVHAWAFEHDCDPATIVSNLFEIEWPPRSGKFITCPEIDRAAFFSIVDARQRILAAQIPLLDELQQLFESGKLRHHQET